MPALSIQSCKIMQMNGGRATLRALVGVLGGVITSPRPVMYDLVLFIDISLLLKSISAGVKARASPRRQPVQNSRQKRAIYLGGRPLVIKRVNCCGVQYAI